MKVLAEVDTTPVLSTVWVDDNMLDGEEDQIEWASERMDSRFKCKGLVWVEPMGKKEDYVPWHGS